MAGMTSKLTRVLVGAAMGAGAVGVILALAGVHSPVRTGLVFLFLAVAPTAAIAGLLRSFDPFARLILAAVSTIAMLTIVAVILLSAGLWSPIGELLGVAAITVACLVLQRTAVRARVAAWARPGWQALLRHIPADRSAAPEGDGTPAGAAAGNGHAAPHAETEARVPGNGQAGPDTAEAPGNGQAGPDTAEMPGNGQATEDTAGTPRNGQATEDTAEMPGNGAAELAGAETATGAETAGPTEVTTPLPAIHD